MERIHENMHVSVLSCKFKHGSTKTHVSMYIFLLLSIRVPKGITTRLSSISG